MSRCGRQFLPLAAWLALATAGRPQSTLPEQVNAAIDGGVAWLKSRQQPDGSFPCNHWSPVGSTALATYALLKSGVLAGDPVIQKAIAFLRYQPFEKTYAVSVEIAALDAYGARGDPEHEKTLLGAAKWLEEQQRGEGPASGKDGGKGDGKSDGLWGYPDAAVDLSNSQYAVLGIWVAERHGYKSKRETWGRLLKALSSVQNADGGFGYHQGDGSTGSMTTAGIAMLTLALERVEGDPRYGSTREKGKAALARAWKWLDGLFSVEGNPHGDRTVSFNHQLYYLFGLERVAAIADRKKIGDHDWYVEGARRIVGMQRKDGSWHDGDATSFALLFLRRATFTGMRETREQDASGAGAAGATRARPGEPVRPGPAVPFFRRWLVCGPIADPKDELLEAPWPGEEKVEPSVGAAFRGKPWRELRAFCDFVDFADAKDASALAGAASAAVLAAPEHVLHHAFTWLHVAPSAGDPQSDAVDAVLWFGSNDGARLLLDGKPIFTRHVHEGAKRDRTPIAVKLAPGVHRLLVRVENDQGPSGFFLRFAHADGSATPEIRPSLEKRGDDLAETALAMPSLFTLAELRAALPRLPRLELRFDTAKELALLAFDPMTEADESYPAWIDEPAPSPRNPAPGARGILAVRPLREQLPARIYARVELPPEPRRLVVRASPDAFGAKGRADCSVRLGVFDGEFAWITEATLANDAAADAAADRKESKGWRTLEAPLGKWAGQDVLLVIECAAGGAEPWNCEFAFFDEIAVR